MFIVQLFIYTVPELYHILRNKGSQGAFDHIYLKKEKYLKKQCREKAVKNNILNNMLVFNLWFKARAASIMFFIRVSKNCFGST